MSNLFFEIFLRSNGPRLPNLVRDLSIPEPNTGCWFWLGNSLDKDGYGMISLAGRHVRAHRLSWMAFNGPVSDDINVLHKCDVRICVNPDHLFIGSQLQNMRDMVSKGRRANFKGQKHGQSFLTDQDVVYLRGQYKIGISITRLAEEMGMSRAQIRDVVKYRAWTHIG